MNLISQKQLMRNNIYIKFVQNDIEFDNRDIIIWLQSNNLYCLRL